VNLLLITGTCLVFLALANYSAGMHFERKARAASDRVLNFLFLGLICDMTATGFMIAGSHNGPFTFHGFLGYSALALMVLAIFLLWQFRSLRGAKAKVPRSLHIYCQAAYAWWVAAFVAGAIMGARLHHGS
jgi:hypothetical protein